MRPEKPLLYLASTLALTLAGCRPAAEPPLRSAAPVPVILGEVRQLDLPVQLRSVGAVQASATVTVKPRVSGLLAAAEYEEGQEVEAGAVLFRIDPRPYEVALGKAQATLVQLREQAANAEGQEKRYQSIGSSGAITQEQLATVKSAARANAGASSKTPPRFGPSLSPTGTAPPCALSNSPGSSTGWKTRKPRAGGTTSGPWC